MGYERAKIPAGSKLFELMMKHHTEAKMAGGPDKKIAWTHHQRRRSTTHSAVRAYPKASTYPPGEPSFLCKPIELNQLHSASTRNRRV